MRHLGWHGPKLMRWGEKTLHGYWRHPTVGPPALVPEEPVEEIATMEELPAALEHVTRLDCKSWIRYCGCRPTEVTVTC
jgi:hypothetical protein